MLNVPSGGGDQSVELPAPIRAEIETSVAEFSKRFGLMVEWARSQGWIEDYQRELKRVATFAYHFQERGT